MLIALTSCGIGYAHWTDTLEIGGTVQTGETNANFIACGSNDPLGSIDPGKDKDVGSCECWIECRHKIIVEIENAYPYYECDIYGTAHNGGTIPERIFVALTFRQDEITVTPLFPHEVICHKTVEIWGKVYQVYLTKVELDPLNPGEVVDVKFNVHAQQQAEEGDTYKFFVNLFVQPWCWDCDPPPIDP